MRRNSEIDVLRGIAVLFVLLAHYRGLVPVDWRIYEMFKFEAGVPLFFAISGAVISGTLIPRLQQDKSARTFAGFYVRRICRILPLAYLWLGLGLLATIYFNVHGSFGVFKANLYGAGAAVLNVANITQAKVLILGNGMFGVYWSLSLEEQFYLLFPLFLVLTPAQYRIKVLCFFLVFLAALWRKPTSGFSLQDAFAIDPMLFGILVYLVFPGFSGYVKGGRPLFFVLILALLAAPAWLWSTGVAYTAVGLTSGLLVAIAWCGKGFVPDPLGILSWIGKRSYGLYLAHGPCIAFVLELSVDQAIRTPIWLVLTFAVTELLHRYVEQPLIEVGRARARLIEG